MPDGDWQLYSNALRRLVQRPRLREQFRQDVDGTATADLGITPEMRTDFENLLLLLQTQDVAEPPDGGAASATSAPQDSFERGALSAQDYFDRTYAYLRRGALATTAMSIAIFLVGLVLLAVATVQSLTGDEPGTTVALAASGIVAIAAAFYRSPVAQMRESAAAVQRSTMVLMSYMLGLSLLKRQLDGEDTGTAGELLNGLTRDLAILLPGAQPPPGTPD
jgi:hypothetical protein